MDSLRSEQFNSMELSTEELSNISGGVTAKEAGYLAGFVVGTLVGAVFAAAIFILD